MISFKMPFGKYKGEDVNEIAKTDAEYLYWVLTYMNNLYDETKDAIILALDEHPDEVLNAMHAEDRKKEKPPAAKGKHATKHAPAPEQEPLGSEDIPF